MIDVLVFACRKEVPAPILTELGVLPSSEFVDDLMRELVRRFPNGGNSLEAALHAAIVTAWYGRDQWRPSS